MKTSLRVVLSFTTLFFGSSSLHADESPELAAILVAGEDWKPVVTGLTFADGLSGDPATGNVFYSNMRAKEPEKPGVFMLTPEGKSTRLLEGVFSGTRLSGDGKTLYAIGSKKLVAFPLPAGPMTVLAENIGTNDLAVRGTMIFFTGNGKQQVSSLDVNTKEVKAADMGNLKSPNGIGVSPDRSKLYVSDSGGLSTWTFTIQPDGSLTDRKATMTMKATPEKPMASGGDGMTVDADGRVYVTSNLGVQVFGADGKALGTIAKPKSSGFVSCAFGGKDLSTLFIAGGDTIYVRKMKVKGIPAATK
ncbi:hypothetical protein BH11PLA2_BH11PLA2_25020 [soil metagenome]